MKNYRRLSEIQKDLESGELSCRDLTQHYLDRIHEKEDLNIFVEVFGEEALARAEEIDQRIADGNAGRLAGMVLSIKDNLCYKGHKVTASSHILDGFESLFSSTVVERLLAEDVIIIGRTNCDEFAMGSSNENSYYGPVGNPLDSERVPGGSSGGAAASVAAGLCLAALGSDTGGSIRQPASFCGVVGVKPTYGRVSRWGLLAYASSLDHIGPFSFHPEDSALVLEVMAGADEHDATSSTEPVDDYAAPMENGSKYRIGYIQECLDMEGLDPEIRQGMLDLIERLKAEGHEVKPVSFPYLDYVVPTYYILTTAEASSNLSRYDGVRFGYRSDEAGTTEEVFIKSRTEGFGPEVKRRIMLGTFVLSAGYYDAYYQRGLKVRRLIRQETKKMLAECDFILSPTTPTPAFRKGAKTEDPIAMYLADIFTVHADLSGSPAVSLPLGQHSSGMPFGVQLLADDFEEKKLLAFGSHLVEHYNMAQEASV